MLTQEDRFLVNILEFPLTACHGLVQSPKASQNPLFTFMLRQDEEKQQRVYNQRLHKTFRTDKFD